ncbi:MAG: TIGR02466 family protein [Alphaproteobacteria bacterium]
MSAAAAEAALARRAWGEALAAADAAIAADPDAIAAHRARAVALLQLRRLPEAEAAVAAVLAIAPDHGPARGTLAGIRLLQGRVVEAANEAERALAVATRQVDALTARAQVRLLAGDIAGALADADAAVSAAVGQPASASALAVRGRVLRRAERAADALADFRHAVSIEPAHGPWRALLADALAESTDFAAAEGEWRAAIASSPPSGRLHAQLAATLAELGRMDEAEAEARRALDASPDDPLAAMALAGVLLAGHREVELALALARRARARAPRAAKPVAIEAVALGMLGRHREAADMLALDRLIFGLRPPAPAPFADAAAFRAALLAGIESDPTLTWEPAATTTRGGYQTSNLLRRDEPAFLALRRLIVGAVDRYRTARGDHAWLKDFPRQVSVYAWATALSAGGRQLAHIHPSAIVSGVFYVAVPPSAATEAGDGWIEFGRPPEIFAVPGEPPTRRVRPEEGAMLLFPSWLYHRTLPFEGEGRRVSIAFDVMAG